MSIELRHLRYFIAVAEEGHITRAAERLEMQQPPLSQQIKSLEQQVGAQLFLRKPRGVQLTEAGSAFLQDARRVLSGMEDAVENTRRTARGEQGRLSIGVTPTAPFHPFVPRVIRAFGTAYPNVALTLEEGLTDDLLRLQRERIDVAFVRRQIGEPEGLTVTPLLEEELWVVLPAEHEHARGKASDLVPLKGLAQEGFVLYGPAGSGIHDATIAACHSAGFSPRIGQLASRITSALGLVAAGLGITLVPESMRCVKLDGVAYRRLKASPLPTATLKLVSRKGDPSAAVQNFVRAAVSRAALARAER